MASVIFSVDELVYILNTNGLLPQKIKEIKAQQQGISFKIKTGLFPLTLISIVAKLVDFQDGTAIFEIVTNPLMKKFDWLFQKWIQSMQLPEYVSKVEYPTVYIDADSILTRKVKGVRIEDITYENGRFSVSLIKI